MGNISNGQEIINNLSNKSKMNDTFENIDEQSPSSHLMNKLHTDFNLLFTASKNIMSEQAKINVKTCHVPFTKQQRRQKCFIVDQKQNNEPGEIIYNEIFQLFNRTKIKKPNFSMIQIDPKKFIIMKETSIKQDYQFLDQIGKGGFGSVFKARSLHLKEMRAIKRIQKNKLDDQQRLNLINEFEILRGLDHPNIIKLYDIYDNEDYFYVVTQLCEGGNLLRLINNNKNKVSEKTIREVMIQLLSAIKYMHNLNIMHRDIKLENIVLVKKYHQKSSKQETLQIKLIDFGISLDLKKKAHRTDQNVQGTLIYMSPEMLLNKISLSGDMWSCGIVLYMIATKKLPYTFRTEDQLISRIFQADYNHKNLQKLAFDYKLLILQLLDKNDKYRLTASHSLQNSWIKKDQKSTLSQQQKYKAASHMLNYDVKNNLVSMIESYLVCKKINQNQRQRLAKIFEEIDQDKSGIIQVEELRKFYKENSGHYDEEEVEHLLQVLDKDKSGKIDFNQFIAGMYSRQKLFQIQSLEQAFDFFDTNKTGTLQKDQIRQMLKGIHNQEVEILFNQIDKNQDQKISKKQFLAYLFKQRGQKSQE